MIATAASADYCIHSEASLRPVEKYYLDGNPTAIQRMQARKLGLVDALFEGTGQGPPGLTGEDIDASLGPVQTSPPLAVNAVE